MLPQGKQSRVVYKIQCSCGKVYICKTARRLHTRFQEHQKACQEGSTALSAVAEHAYQHQHPIQWEETSIVDQARGHRELLLSLWPPPFWSSFCRRNPPRCQPVCQLAFSPSLNLTSLWSSYPWSPSFSSSLMHIGNHTFSCRRRDRYHGIHCHVNVHGTSGSTSTSRYVMCSMSNKMSPHHHCRFCCSVTRALYTVQLLSVACCMHACLASYLWWVLCPVPLFLYFFPPNTQVKRML